MVTQDSKSDLPLIIFELDMIVKFIKTNTVLRFLVFPTQEIKVKVIDLPTSSALCRASYLRHALRFNYLPLAAISQCAGEIFIM